MGLIPKAEALERLLSDVMNHVWYVRLVDRKEPPVHFPDQPGRSLVELFSLKGRAAVVTGGASGIGHAICLRLSEAGANVAVADLDEKKATETAKSIQDRGGKAISVRLDARDPSSHAALADRTVEAFGRLDVWINDAGVYPIKAALDITPADWDQVIGLNLGGMFFGAQAAVRRMGAGGGVIVMIASSLGYHGVKQQVSYVASKFGVRGLVAALALEWAERGIRVLAVAPGMIDVPSMRKAAADMHAPIDLFAAYVGSSPAGRAGVPDDIARAVVVAVSDLATFQTGSTILVDGGEVAMGGAA
jgi:NAD(P)-dependent dehydrogenase (short-subunit alcohol dehydrogenase family)